MKPLHSWNVSVEEAIKIQEVLRDRIILKNTFPKVYPLRNSSRALNPDRIILGSNTTTGRTAEQRGIISNVVKTIGGGDVAYSKKGDHLFGAIVVLSFPDMKILDTATADGKIPFPYIPTLLSFREGPILIKTFKILKIKPDVMIYDGQGIAHPRGIGLASHMGLWFDLPSIGCAKTPLIDEFTPYNPKGPDLQTGDESNSKSKDKEKLCPLVRRFTGLTSPGPLKGSFGWIQRESENVGAVLRTKQRVKPVYVSPGHRIDLVTSIRIVLECCQEFRIPEPLRLAHQLAKSLPAVGRHRA
jgi:deoxyribonuclease V